MKTWKALLLMAGLLVLDQVSKYMAVINLRGNPGIEIIPGVFRLYYLENNGAAFGIFRNQQVFFYIITVVVVGLLAFFYLKLPKDKKYLPICLCMVFMEAGALGNFIDRVWHKYVVDFFYFELINFPVFNVADIYVTCSAAVLIFLLLFVYKEE